MNRRQLLRHTAMAAAAFAISRDSFARKAEQTIAGYNTAGIIKLSSNENPHGPSPAAREAMTNAVINSNRYPWETTNRLREKIGAGFGLKAQNVLIGAGSSELLGVASVWAALKKGNAVAADPTFRLWMPAARRLGLPIQLVPLTAGKKTDLQRMRDASGEDTRMIYICNPANPTGTIIPASELEQFIKDTPAHCMILLDEAYTEFCDEPSMAKLVDSFPNLVVAKTFSKIYGLAGARIGYMLAHPETIQALSDLMAWSNAGAGTVALAGAMASFGDEKFIQYCRTQNDQAKKIFYEALEKKGMKYIPSSTSFVYFNTDAFAGDLKSYLESKNIIGVRSFEEGSSWRRLSIGTIAEMQEVARHLNG